MRSSAALTKSTRNARIFSGSTSRHLAVAVAKRLGLNLGNMTAGRFTDGEVRVRIEESVRGNDCYVVQSVCRYDDGSVNDALVELLLIIASLRRASAHTITAVIPYYGYARQDRMLRERVPISASEVGSLSRIRDARRRLCDEYFVLKSIYRVCAIH